MNLLAREARQGGAGGFCIVGLTQDLAVEYSHLVRADDQVVWVIDGDTLGLGQGQALDQSLGRLSIKGRFVDIGARPGVGDFQSIKKLPPPG